MEIIKKIGKGIIVALVVLAAVLVVGLAGQLDHDEYIEANLRNGASHLSQNK